MTLSMNLSITDPRGLRGVERPRNGCSLSDLCFSTLRRCFWPIATQPFEELTKKISKPFSGFASVEGC
jgi:hypothetical protein